MSISPLNTLAASYIAMMMTMQGWNFLLQLWDPFKYGHTVVATPIVHRGDDLIQLVDVERYRICRVKIDRFMVHEQPGNITDNTIMLRIGDEPGGASQIGHFNGVPVHVQVPMDALLGRACMIQRSFSECVDGLHATPWPKVCFEIVE